MKNYLRVFIIACGVLCFLIYDGTASQSMRFTRNKCTTHDPKTIQNLTCSLKPINRTVSYINISGYITRNVSNILVNAQLFKKSEISYRPFLVNVTEDYCDFFAKNKGGAYMRLAAPIYLPHTNMNHTCPYYGYGYVKDLPLESSKIVSYFPPGNYRLDLHISEKDYGKLFTVQLTVEII